MERRGAHALDAQRAQPCAQLARGLVGEGDRDDRGRVERAARDLPRDASGDRRRLAGACAREDAHGPARCLRGSALLRVQASENALGVHRSTVPGPPVGFLTRASRLRYGWTVWAEEAPSTLGSVAPEGSGVSTASRFGSLTIEPSFATTSSVSPSSASRASSSSWA